MPGTQPIEHVVVLMLENRSFDHIFGYRPGVNGLQGNEFNLLDPTKPVSDANPAYYVSNGAPFAISVGQGPGHAFADANVQQYNSARRPRPRLHRQERGGSFEATTPNCSAPIASRTRPRPTSVW